MFKAIIFDYDGVIADTLEPNYQAWLLIAADIGFTLPPREKFGGLMTKAWTEVLKDFGVDSREKFNRTQEIYQSYIYHLSKDVRPFVDVGKLLQLLHEGGYRLGIASGNYTEYLKHQLAQFAFADYFDIISGHDDFDRIKPDPAQLNFIIKHMAIAPHELAYIGDMTVDVGAGKAAGVGKIIGAAWGGWHTAEMLVEAGADVVARDPMEILNHLD